MLLNVRPFSITLTEVQGETIFNNKWLYTTLDSAIHDREVK